MMIASSRFVSAAVATGSAGSAPGERDACEPPTPRALPAPKNSPEPSLRPPSSGGIMCRSSARTMAL